MRRRYKLALVGIVSALTMSIAAFAGGVAANADAASDTYKVWTWNVAGWKINKGSTTNGMVKGAASSIQNREADFAVFNEMCHSQYKAMITSLRDAGWPADNDNFARFDETHSSACDGGAFGNAVFSQQPLGAAKKHTLPSDGRVEQRSLLCVPLKDKAKVRMCATHITPSNEVIDGEKINEQQLNKVNALMEDYHADGATAIISGDFNAQPDYGRLNNWYSSTVDTENNSNNSGKYRELDDNDAKNCPGYGENTVENSAEPGPCDENTKIDMIFVREDRIAGDYNGDALAISDGCGGPCSDHRIITGTVTVETAA